MDSHTLFVVEVGLTVIWAASVIAAAWFEMRDRAQSDEGRLRTREWYGGKWRTIRDSGLLELPEKVISSFLGTKATIAEYTYVTADWVLTGWRVWPFMGWVLLGVAAIPNISEPGRLLPWPVTFGFMFLATLALDLFEAGKLRTRVPMMVFGVVFGIAFAADLVLGLLELPIVLATLKMVFVAPLCALFLSIPIKLVSLQVRRMAFYRMFTP